MEYQLFENLFPGGDPSGGALSPRIDTQADMLYDTLRPAYIHLQDLAALCQLVDILQREVHIACRQTPLLCPSPSSHAILLSYLSCRTVICQPVARTLPLFFVF